MRFIRVKHTPYDPGHCLLDQGDAKDITSLVPAGMRDSVMIEEIEVDTNKLAIMRLLNGQPTEHKVQRAWSLTRRGAWTEEPL